MKRILLGLGAAALCATAFGQVLVYHNGPAEGSTTNFFGPGGITNGHTAERGDEVTLAAGTPRTITEMTVYYLLAVDAIQGDETFRIRLYRNDGPNVSGRPSPGTIIWDSGQIPAKAGLRAHRIVVPNVVVPDTFTWTLKPEGVTQVFNEFQADAMGASFFGPPTVGTSDSTLWRRNEPTGSWILQDFVPPYTVNNPYGSFGMQMWSGGPSTPYDNTMAIASGFATDTREFGDDVSMEGPNRQVNSFTIEYNSDFQSPQGNEGVIIRFYQVDPTDPNGGPAATPFWTSPETLIDTSPGEHSLTIPVPNVTVPNDFVWTAVFTNQSALSGFQAGPLLKTPPIPGASVAAFWMKTGLGQNGYESFWFGNPTPDPNLQPPDANSPIANFAVKISATAGAQVLTAQSVSFTPGIIVGGTVQNLNASDDQYLTVRPGIVFSTQQDPIVMNLSFTAPQGTASQLQFRHEARAQQNNIRQTIYGYNFTTAMYVQLDQRTLPLTDTVVTVNLAPTVDFIGPGNEIRTRVNYRTVGPVFSYPWLVFMDESVVLFTP